MYLLLLLYHCSNPSKQKTAPGTKWLILCLETLSFLISKNDGLSKLSRHHVSSFLVET